MVYDIIIRNGYVVDGSGNPWFKADIGILNGRIAKVGKNIGGEADKIIDANRLFVSPGFIDIHTHSDLSLLINPKADSKIRQGVTTEVIGNCGLSAAPLNRENLKLHKKLFEPYSEYVSWSWRTMGEYFRVMESNGLCMNVAALVGHGTIRTAVMGFSDRSPTRMEMEEMKLLVDQSMMDGCFGLSTGLVYPPNCFSSTEEIVELCSVVAKHGGIYATHIRGERESFIDAVREALLIGEKTGVPVQLSHNAPKYGAWSMLKKSLKIIEEARIKGIDVTIDNDTQRDWHGFLTSILPPKMQIMDMSEVLSILENSLKREEVKREIIEDKIPGFGPVGLVKHGRWDKIILFKSRRKDLVGKSFSEISKILNKDPFELYFDMLIEEIDAEVVFSGYISEDDIVSLLKHPLSMISTDSIASSSYGVLGRISSYYPASYGEYPRILGKYVRDDGVLRLEEAIRKATSLPAQRLGIFDRGIIREGMWADIVVFDLDKVKDNATNRFPHEYPDGIKYVIVNGEIVVEDEEYTGSLPGMVLRHKPQSSNMI